MAATIAARVAGTWLTGALIGDVLSPRKAAGALRRGRAH